MLSKKVIPMFFVVIILISLIFINCDKSNQEKAKINPTLKEPEIEIIELEEKVPPTIAVSEWSVINEEEYVKRSILILNGTIIDKKEYVIKNKRNDRYTAEYYKTVYSVKVSDIYHSDDKEVIVGETIKIMSPVTSYTWDPEAVQIEKGQEFIFFTGLVRDMETSSGTVKLTDLAKYFIGNPFGPIISVKEDSFKFDPVFKSLSSNATIEEQKISDNYSKEILVRNDENFIQDLKEMISKYK